MKNTDNYIKVNKVELDIIKKVTDLETDLFTLEQLNDKKHIIIFDKLEKALELDELIKDIYIYKGFDIKYNLTEFGRICEKLIDKLYEILK
ncbi:hypothetical protein [Patiriisocius hiemis]|uniref:Uncharacterized protein n=1 Tax=Patiriisocius hiemis TaxID=3075604 RepID=A0ABU2YAY0_9FLAO|nr:hypothetical protein [Constantimarinum sp. W242]MDT0555350.1 hypothetical protein [Constantimarinum sp. W242]